MAQTLNILDQELGEMTTSSLVVKISPVRNDIFEFSTLIKIVAKTEAITAAKNHVSGLFSTTNEAPKFS